MPTTETSDGAAYLAPLRLGRYTDKNIGGS